MYHSSSFIMNFLPDYISYLFSGRHSSGEENVQLDFSKGEFFLFFAFWTNPGRFARKLFLFIASTRIILITVLL